MSDETPKEQEISGGSVRLFQISEPDLADLERIIPSLQHATMQYNNNRERMQWRAVKKILSDVRWDYTPPIGDVEVIPA